MSIVQIGGCVPNLKRLLRRVLTEGIFIKWYNLELSYKYLPILLNQDARLRY